MSVPRLPRYRMTRPSVFTALNRTETKVPFTNVPDNSPTGAFTVPGNSTVTVNWTGLYMIRTSVLFGNPAFTWKFAGVSVYINGVFDDWVAGAYGVDTTVTRLNGTTYKQLVKGDNIGIYCYQAQTTGDDILTMGGDAFTSVDVVFMGKV